jgi:hypothetical protein
VPAIRRFLPLSSKPEINLSDCSIYIFVIGTASAVRFSLPARETPAASTQGGRLGDGGL